MTTADDYIENVLKHMPQATPLRAQIAQELRGHFAERAAGGQSIDAIAGQLGEPARLAEQYLAAVPLVAVSFLRRAWAKVVDACAVVLSVAMVVVPLALAAWYWKYEFLLIWAPLLAILSISFLFAAYTISAEYQWGQTVGKRLLGMRVVRESGARISLGQAFVRQMPMFLQIFAIDALFALFTDKNQRAFELLSKTRVVQSAPESF